MYKNYYEALKLLRKSRNKESNSEERKEAFKLLDIESECYSVSEWYDKTLDQRNTKCILGKSGSGKTTYLRRLVDQRHYYCNCSKPIFIEYMNGLDNCSFINVRKEEIIELSDLFEITNILRRSVSSYSDGEKQRLAVIRELLRFNTYTVMLDEPTSSLDDRMSEIVMKEIVHQSDCIVATHDRDLSILFKEVVDLDSTSHGTESVQT